MAAEMATSRGVITCSRAVSYQYSAAKCQQLSATQVSAIVGHPGAWYNGLKTFP